MLYRRIVPPVLWALCVALCGIAAAEPPEAGQKGRFLRLARGDDESPTALEAAIVRHAPPAGRSRSGSTVDLISAVHVADRKYYEQLNRLFQDYDAVLYELVAPEGTRIPKGGPEVYKSPVSKLQNLMTDFLELEFQLRGIDYTRPNLVHADMTAEQFVQSMRQRGESMLKVFLRIMGYAFSQQAKSPGGSGDLRLLWAFFDKNRALAIKRIMAEQFEDMEGSLAAINGPEGSTLITERNKVALEVLRQQLDAGKRKVAIFYGAGHMPDFQQRLHNDFGMVPIGTRWLAAWNLTAEPTSGPSAQPADRRPVEAATRGSK